MSFTAAMAPWTALLTLACTSATSAAEPFQPGLAVEWGGEHRRVPGSNPDLTGGYPLQKGDRFGRSSAAIGDLDGDGIPDAAACSSRDSDGVHRGGAVYILFLTRSGEVARSQKISMLYGGFASAASKAGQPHPALGDQDRLGYSLAGLGDVDGDGIPDLLAGADGDDDGHSVNASSQPGAGAVYILFLKADGTVNYQQKISNSYGGLAANLADCHGCVPLADGDGFGQSAAALGDYDDDGVPDAMVGAPGAGSGGTLFMLLLNRDGSVKKASRISATLGGFSSASGAGSISSTDAFTGRGVALLGDLDNDGKQEIVVGSYGADTSGAVWILWVSLDKSLQFQVTKKQKISSDGTGGFPFIIASDAGGSQRNTAGAQFGHSLAALGDIDGDGVPDLALSANNLGSGTIFMLTLRNDGTVKTGVQIDSSTGGAFSSLASLPAGDRLARSLSAPGDVRGDGGFTIICGAGASSTGDIWLLAFDPNSCATGSNNSCPVYPAGLPLLEVAAPTTRLTTTTVPPAIAQGPATVLTGSMTMRVKDPFAFVTDSVAKGAVAKAIAQLTGISVSYISLTVTAVRRLGHGLRRFGEAGHERNLAGSVQVAYTITIPLNAGVVPSAVATALSPPELATVAGVIEGEVSAAKDLGKKPFRITVTSVTPVTITEVTTTESATTNVGTTTSPQVMAGGALASASLLVRIAVAILGLCL